MVHAALPRLDDRRRFDRNPQEPHRRAPLRPPVRPAPAQAGRGGGMTLTVSSPELTNSNLRDALFSPRSVAIVGQSDDATKTAGRPLKFLRRIGYAGRVYPINPRRETVLGERAWPALAALPEPPEHAYIVTPTEAAVAAVEECGQLGVKVATVLADGFAEAGAEGIARETRLRETCARTGIRIVGPSSLGVVDLRTRVMLTANAAFDEKDFPLGRIFAASHSGSMIGALMSRGKARGTGFAGFVSVGNEVDLSLGEICAATLDDPEIDGYMLFLETMRHADTAALCAFGGRARQADHRLQAWPLGRRARACGLAYRRARGRGRHRRSISQVLRHRTGRHARGPDRGSAAALARAGRGSRRAQARRRGNDHGGGRDHGGRSAREPRRDHRAGERCDLGAARRRRHRGQARARRRSYRCRGALPDDEGRARYPHLRA